MKNLLFSGLAALEDLVDPEGAEDSCDDDMLEAAELAIMESGKAFDEKAAELKMIYDNIDAAEESLCRIEAIRKSIDTYGICQATMEAADPNHELINVGICGSYEDLNDVPTKGDDANLTIDGLDLAIEGIYENIKTWFKRLLDHNFKMKMEMEKEVHDLEVSVRAAVSAVGNCEKIDEKIFGATHLNSYHSKAFAVDMKGYERLTEIISDGKILNSVKNIEAAMVKDVDIQHMKKMVIDACQLTKMTVEDKGIRKSLGMHAVISDGGESIECIFDDKRTQYKETGTAHELGWTVKSVDKLLNDNKMIVSRLHDLVDHFDNYNRVVSSVIDKAANHEDTGLLRYSIKHIEPLLICQHTLYNTARGVANMLITSSIKVVKAAVDASKQKE